MKPTIIERCWRWSPAPARARTRVRKWAPAQAPRPGRWSAASREAGAGHRDGRGSARRGERLARRPGEKSPH